MTAKEAFNIANNTPSVDLIEKIKKEAGNGYYGVSLNGEMLSGKNRKWLLDNGYTIEELHNDTIIRWDFRC